MHMVQRCLDIRAFSLNKDHLTDSGFSSLKVFSVVFMNTDSTSPSTISDVSCPLQQVVQLLLIPGGIDSPCHGFRWQPLAGLLAFSEARPSTGRWGVGISLFEARMHEDQMGRKTCHTKEWDLKIIFGSQPFFDLRMWKLGGFFS